MALSYRKLAVFTVSQVIAKVKIAARDIEYAVRPIHIAIVDISQINADKKINNPNMLDDPGFSNMLFICGPEFSLNG